MPHIAFGSEHIVAALDDEKARGTPFLFVPVFMGIGAVAYFANDTEPAFAPIVVALVLFAGLWRIRQSRGHRAWLSGVLVCLALGAFFAKAETARMQSTMLGGEITTVADMRVLRVDRDGRQIRIVADVLATRAPQLKYQPGRVRVTLRAAQLDVKAGDVITGRFGLRPPGGPVRPDSYDFAFHSYFAGIGASGFSMGKISKVDGPEPSTAQSMRFALENLRARIADIVRAAIPGTSGNVSAALIAGVSGGIDPENEEALRLTGLAHVLSISGLHMALVAGAVMLSIRFVFALFPAFSSRYPVKKWAAAMALAISFFYLLLSGSGVATLRSFIMLAVMLVAILFDRQALTLRNLAIAALIILVFAPHEVMGPSFQMSFAATAALISAYGWASMRRENKFNGRDHSRWQSLRTVAWGAFLTPLVAGFATALFSAWHFHRLAPMGLPANLAAMPVISAIIMPFAMIGTLALPFGLEELPFEIMGKGVDAMLWIARYFASLSPEGKSGALASEVFLILVVAFLVLTLCQTRLRFLALCLLPMAAVAAVSAHKPELLVSEDAKLAAIADRDGNLSVNRNRPNAFTTQVWQNATAAAILVKPETAAAELPFKALLAAANSSTNRFECSPSACVAATVSGAAVAWLDPASDRPVAGTDPASQFAPVSNEIPPSTDGSNDAIGPGESASVEPEGAKPKLVSRQFAKIFFDACDQADLVITAAAVPFRSCGTGKAVLIRADALAKKGAAEIRFENYQPVAASASEVTGRPASALDGRSQGASETTAASRKHAEPDVARKRFAVHIKYAVGEPQRPWNRERVFSRAARNMLEYQRAARPVAAPVENSAPAADSSPARIPAEPHQTHKAQ
ncbi:MAG: ComEC/Rec2 family competence protein [Rhizobiaceae bacterium]